jgi:hypothetical protein
VILLWHPVLDRFHRVGSRRAADVYRRSGWTDPPPTEVSPDDSAAAEFFISDHPQQEIDSWHV